MSHDTYFTLGDAFPLETKIEARERTLTENMLPAHRRKPSATRLAVRDVLRQYPANEIGMFDALPALHQIDDGIRVLAGRRIYVPGLGEFSLHEARA